MGGEDRKLVMEMGGMMSLSAVVACEYGIPTVVGVAAATELIMTGQQITVDELPERFQLKKCEASKGNEVMISVPPIETERLLIRPYSFTFCPPAA